MLLYIVERILRRISFSLNSPMSVFVTSWMPSKYSDDWHRQHLDNPRAMVPGSIMPAYPWLAKRRIDA